MWRDDPLPRLGNKFEQGCSLKQESPSLYRAGSVKKAELTAIIDRATEGGYWAICPEISGANGQGETIEEAKENLKLAIQLIIEDPMADIPRGITEDAIEKTILFC